MRVALLHYTAQPVVGGVELVLARQARLMADAGHGVTVIAGRGRAPDARTGFVRIPLADTRHPRILALQAALNDGAVPAAFATVRQRLEDALQSAAAGHDVLVAHNVCSLHMNLALTAALARLNGTPGFPRVVAWHHDLAWTAARYRADLHPGEPWDLLRTAWPGVVHAAVSDERRAALADLLGVDPAGIAVVANGIDRDAFLGLDRRTRALLRRLALETAAPILLLPVRIAPRKNIALARRYFSFGVLRRHLASLLAECFGEPA
jgi:glycosyltransferase involved in cell wall biosynthesis